MRKYEENLLLQMPQATPTGIQKNGALCFLFRRPIYKNGGDNEMIPQSVVWGIFFVLFCLIVGDVLLLIVVWKHNDILRKYNHILSLMISKERQQELEKHGYHFD